MGATYVAPFAANASEPISVAVTVDDLPGQGPLSPGWTRVRVARAVLRALHDNGITQAYGFPNGYVEASEHEVNPRPEPHDAEVYRVLKLWLQAGYPLGNHSYDHLDLDKVSAQTYIADIFQMDQLLQKIAPGSSPIRRRHVFRYPYLAEGDTLQKRDAVRSYLSRNGYRIAEVTVDYNDWAWGNAYARCIEARDRRSLTWLKTHVVEDAEWHLGASTRMAKLLLHRNIPQILLVHVGVFDAVMLDTILKDFRAHGVRFITLDRALSDPAYKINPDYAFRGGRTFLAQLAETRHADIDKYMAEIYPVEKLDTICARKE